MTLIDLIRYRQTRPLIGRELFKLKTKFYVNLTEAEETRLTEFINDESREGTDEYFEMLCSEPNPMILENLDEFDRGYYIDGRVSGGRDVDLSIITESSRSFILSSLIGAIVDNLGDLDDPGYITENLFALVPQILSQGRIMYEEFEKNRGKINCVTAMDLFKYIVREACSQNYVSVNFDDENNIHIDVYTDDINNDASYCAVIPSAAELNSYKLY
jgi:hypothetical protein